MILYFKDQLTVFILSIKQKHDPKIHLYGLHLWNSQIKLNAEKLVSHAANFFAFLIHKVVCFSLVYAQFDFLELFVTLVHVLYMSYEKWVMIRLLV